MIIKAYETACSGIRYIYDRLVSYISAYIVSALFAAYGG